MYTEKDLYDGMMLIWTSKTNYTDIDVYKWNKYNETVSANRGRNSPCSNYPASKILFYLNEKHCRPEPKEFVPLIFN